jgi:hypothetical protein
LAKFEIKKIDSREGLIEIKSGMQALFSAIFGKEFSDSYWEHIYLNSPYGVSTAFIAENEKKEVVASVGIIPQQLIDSKKQPISFYLQSGLMIHQDYQNLILFNDLMQAVHNFINEKNTFDLAFPNHQSFGPFVKMLKWKHIRDYDIFQYQVKEGADSTIEYSTENFNYELDLNDGFLKWRGEINQMQKIVTDEYQVIYKKFEDAMEILDISGKQVPIAKIALDNGFQNVNIPDCFLEAIHSEGLEKQNKVGIEQRMCIYPNNYSNLDYNKIRPLLLLSDVF